MLSTIPRTIAYHVCAHIVGNDYNDNEKLVKFIRIAKQYTEIEELTPDILHSFVDRIYIGETEVYEGQKFQDIKIVYNLVGAIDLPQCAM